jgi:1-acyl-sn-glycerol-3-phosphate acyltransferase
MRGILRQLIRMAFGVLTDFRIEGQENLPPGGPLILVGNHFSFIDPVAMIRVIPWQVEILGGDQNPGSPAWTRIFPKLWGRYSLYRGTGSRFALRAGEEILAQGGVLGIFPEAGNWATVLRPARPGTAFLAVRTGAPLLPMGFDGLLDVFPRLRQGHRARVTVRIGKLFGPFRVRGRGRERRRQLDEIGHEIMGRIADLIPPERRGHYSDDPAIRAAAQGTEIYPWAEIEEGQIPDDMRW